jgi:hypothetical protein
MKTSFGKHDLVFALMTIVPIVAALAVVLALFMC